MAKMTGLGKGLDALFGPTPEEEKMQENDILKNEIHIYQMLGKYGPQEESAKIYDEKNNNAESK